nr:MAG TPA: hypothetical protein [Caudoviricetes sp.]
MFCTLLILYYDVKGKLGEDVVSIINSIVIKIYIRSY